MVPRTAIGGPPGSSFDFIDIPWDSSDIPEVRGYIEALEDQINVSAMMGTVTEFVLSRLY